MVYELAYNLVSGNSLDVPSKLFTKYKLERQFPPFWFQTNIGLLPAVIVPALIEFIGFTFSLKVSSTL